MDLINNLEMKSIWALLFIPGGPLCTRLAEEAAEDMGTRHRGQVSLGLGVAGCGSHLPLEKWNGSDFVS